MKLKIFFLLILGIFAIIYFNTSWFIPNFSEPPKRLYIKEIDSHPIKLEWFFYSTISSISPGYITIEKEKKIDTICISDNIADLNIDNNKIIIGFYGSPKFNNNSIVIPKNKFGFKINIDSTYINNSQKSHQYYLKE